MKDKIYLLSSLLVFFLLNLFKDQIDPYFYNVIIIIGVNVILAVSLNLINGYTGQFSLGHAGFMAIGAYLSAAISAYFAPWFQGTFGTGVLGSSISFLIVLIMGGGAAAIAGLIVGVPSLRLKGDYLAITTLGFSEIIRIVIQSMDVVGASQGFSRVYIFENGVKASQIPVGFDNIPFNVYDVPKFTDIFWTFGFVAIIIFVVNNLINSTYGRNFIAVKDDEVAAEAMGVNTTKYKVIAFVTGAFFAGIAGVLYSHFSYQIAPEDFNFVRSVEIVVMVILGGMGNMVGVVIAAILLTILPEFLREFSDLRMIIYSLLLVIMMLTRPQGIFGGFKPSKLNFRKKAEVKG